MKREEQLLVAKAKLEVYREVELKIEEILENSSDVLFDYENELFLKIQSLENEVGELENVSEYMSMSESVKDLIMSLESWEQLDASQAAIIRSIIEIENVRPISTSNSLHVSESRYEIDGETFRLIGALSGNVEDDIVEKLKK